LARRYSDRKALSPVISTLLMISATITMFVILFAGFVPSITLTQSQANIWYSKQGDAARERIAIEMVVFKTPQYIDVYVRNVQDIEVQITGIFIIENPDSGTPIVHAIYQTFIPPPLPATVNAKTGGVGVPAPVVMFEVQYPWVPSTNYGIKVVTARGSDAVYRALAP